MVSGEDCWIRRYEKHILLPQIGVAGQKKLNASKVLIVGLGRLGSPAAYYLTAVGVGKIGLVDDDKVELSNLQRQILHFASDVGKEKVKSAQTKIKKINPNTKVQTYKERLNKENIFKIIKGYDIILDGSDNFPTKFLLNDACVIKKKPLVAGAISSFSGQTTIFTQEKDSACYRCLFPEIPPRDQIPTCAESGVLGIVPGIIGVIQATETVKYLLNFEKIGIGKLLKNRLLIYDSTNMTFTEFQYKKDSNCQICSKKDKTLDDFVYEQVVCETA